MNAGDQSDPIYDLALGLLRSPLRAYTCNQGAQGNYKPVDNTFRGLWEDKSQWTNPSSSLASGLTVLAKDPVYTASWKMVS